MKSKTIEQLQKQLENLNALLASNTMPEERELIQDISVQVLETAVDTKNKLLKDLLDLNSKIGAWSEVAHNAGKTPSDEQTKEIAKLLKVCNDKRAAIEKKYIE